MPIDFVARAPHFIDHLAPIFAALPSSHRGLFFTKRSLRNYATCKGIYARACSNRARLSEILAQRKGPLVTSSYGELRLANLTRRPQIFLNHGAGFRYAGDFPGFAGSMAGRERVALFLSPSSQSAQLEKEACPWADAVAVGCPKLDVWHRRARIGWRKRSGQRPTVVVSFHFDAGPVPEMRSALPHYRSGLRALANDFDVIGHGHPRWRSSLSRIFGESGIRFEPSFERVLEIADVYICDNSSTTFEFASTDRPVILLNAPWYRKFWTHPGNPRFWEHADVGLQCDAPEDLPALISAAIEDPPALRSARRKAVESVYAYRDGRATARAVKAILETADRLTSRQTQTVQAAVRIAAVPPVRPKPSAEDRPGASNGARRFGIVITNRNRPHGIENCLESIAHQTLKPEWVTLADLASGSEARCMLAWQAKRFGVSYLRIDYSGPWNKGLAFNTAVRHMAAVPYIVQVDADMIMAPDLLDHASGILAAHQAVAYIPRFASRVAIPRHYDGTWKMFNRLLSKTRPSRSNWAIGGFIVLPRKWLFDNRGIDESYVGWGLEDSDLWWRATCDLTGHVEIDGTRLIHQWHRPQKKSPISLSRMKERFYTRALGEPLPTNPEDWGRGHVSQAIMRLGIHPAIQAEDIRQKAS